MNMQIFFREEIFRFTLSEMFFMLPGFVAFAARCLWMIRIDKEYKFQ